MNAQLIEEILDELDPIFQSTGTSAGIVRLLKDKGIVNDDDLAPYLEQAATAGSIKWRATRLRLERILKSAVKSIEDELSEKQKKALEEAKAAANICPPRIRRKQQTTEVKQGVNRDEQKQGAMHASQTKTSEANASGTSQNESAITFDAKTPAAQPPDNGSGKQAEGQLSREAKAEETNTNSRPSRPNDSDKNQTESSHNSEPERRRA